MMNPNEKVKVLVLTGDGVNCERETANAFELAGASSEIRHINEFIENSDLLESYNILALPGGFSFGDELGSGKVFSLKLKKIFGEKIRRFVDKGGPVIGICNGFQVLTKLDLFTGKPVVGLAGNENGKFINKWVTVKIQETPSIWLKNIYKMKLPIRHGEGRIVFDESINQDSIEDLINKGIFAMKYEGNPNGSQYSLAGLSDETGLVFGLMPHPEAAVNDALYPGGVQEGDLGLSIFRNAVNYIQEKQEGRS